VCSSDLTPRLPGLAGSSPNLANVAFSQKAESSTARRAKSQSRPTATIRASYRRSSARRFTWTCSSGSGSRDEGWLQWQELLLVSIAKLQALQVI